MLFFKVINKFAPDLSEHHQRLFRRKSSIMRIKVCGIKRVEDAVMAAYCGADAIGLVVGRKHNSDDFIDKHLAQKIVENARLIFHRFWLRNWMTLKKSLVWCMKQVLLLSSCILIVRLIVSYHCEKPSLI